MTKLTTYCWLNVAYRIFHAVPSWEGGAGKRKTKFKHTKNWHGARKKLYVLSFFFFSFRLNKCLHFYYIATVFKQASLNARANENSVTRIKSFIEKCLDHLFHSFWWWRSRKVISFYISDFAPCLPLPLQWFNVNLSIKCSLKLKKKKKHCFIGCIIFVCYPYSCASL